MPPTHAPRPSPILVFVLLAIILCILQGGAGAALASAPSATPPAANGGVAVNSETDTSAGAPDAASLPSTKGADPGAAAAPGDPSVRYFVDVPRVGAADLRKLSAMGFDIAGFEAGAGVAGLVATARELETLTALGYSYVVREASHPLDQSPLALSDYTDPAEMSVFMDQVQAAFPTLAKKVLVKSGLFDGHAIYAMKITRDVDQPNNRPRFALDAQHHAREVMTAEIAKDMIDYLTSRYATDSQVRNWVDNIEIWIVPVVNPDGAAWVFSSDNSWRRNRHPGCPVDLNRNYDVAWGACNGSSASCTSDTFRGASPASEPETQGMKQFFSDVHAFFGLSYHSYGEYLMYSYGCSDPDEMAVMDGIAQALDMILVKDNGTAGAWLTGPIWSTIYTADGGSVDTEYARYGTYSYVIEVNASGFQPDYATWRNITVQRQRTAWQFFLDQTLTAPQIRGRITDALTGQPLAAQVSVQEVTFTHGESPRTADPRGLYNWLVDASTLSHVTFSMPGYCSQTHTVSVGAGPYTLDVALTHPAAPPSPLATAGGDNRINLSWSPVSGATEYRILRSLSQGGPYAQVAAVAAPGTSWQDNPVSGGVTYYYVVRAFNACESPDSAEVSAATTGPCTIGPAFAGLSSVANGAGTTCALALSWPPAAPRCGGAVTYRVHRATTPSFTPSAANLVASGLSGTSWTDHASLATGAAYYYIVRSVDAASGADDGNSVTVGGIPTGPSALGTWTDDAGDTGAARLALTAPWTVLATGGKTAPKVYATGTYAANICAPLTTPVLELGANAVLTFQSKYDLETNWDAGVVEIATDPTFTNWTKLTTVNYPNTLTNSGNACGFATGGAGTAFSLTVTTPAYAASPYSGSLSAYGGRQVKLRWSLSSDASVQGKGWWIDDIAVTNVLIPGPLRGGAASNPKEVSPAGRAMTCSKTGSGGAVRVAYTPGCGALDNAAYWGTGPIAGSLHWTGAACGLGNTGLASFDPGTPPPGGLIYFVLVGQTGTREGSYGLSWNGTIQAERPEASRHRRLRPAAGPVGLLPVVAVRSAATGSIGIPPAPGRRLTARRGCSSAWSARSTSRSRPAPRCSARSRSCPCRRSPRSLRRCSRRSATRRAASDPASASGCRSTGRNRSS